MRRTLIAVILLLTSLCAASQTVVGGRVLSSDGQGIPYATLQLVGSSTGVVCNDDGQFILRLPSDSPTDSIEIRSMGYHSLRLSLSDLAKRGQRNKLRLTPLTVELREVNVKDYRSAHALLRAALKRVPLIYHHAPSVSIFFCRDWRAIDDEMYLFDESVMSLWRAGYNHASSKRSYAYISGQREMASDYKTLLRHRTALCDYSVLLPLVHNADGVMQLMEYDDNSRFHDPIATPQASYLLADRMLKRHTFSPISEISVGDERFYIVRSTGPSRQGTANYQYTIRKDDLAIVAISSSQRNASLHAPQDSWVSPKYNKMLFLLDSSSWSYEQRDGHYVLSHYYNSKDFQLVASNRNPSARPQHHQRCIDWRLTDFSSQAPLSPPADTIGTTTVSMLEALGASDFEPSFWGKYQTITIDTVPARMLEQALRRIVSDKK